MDHYIGIDVGTGSARACIINAKGDIVGLASENIGLWQPEQGYYVSNISIVHSLHFALLFFQGDGTQGLDLLINANTLRRSNLQMTSGDAYVLQFDEPRTSTT